MASAAEPEAEEMALAAEPEAEKITSAAEPEAENPSELPKASLEDTLKPNMDSDFKWPKTAHSECWNLFLHGTSARLVKPSYENIWIVDYDSIIVLFRGVISDGYGINLLNTIRKVYDRGIGIVKESLIFGIACCSCSDDATVKSKAFELMMHVCSQSMSFLIFINFRERIHRHIKSTTGWSHALRNAVKKWYRRYPPIEMARIITECPRHNKWTHKDVLALSHLAPQNNGEKMLFSYIVAGIKRTSVLFKNDSADEDDEGQNVLQFLEDVTTVRSAKNSTEIVLLMDKLKLPWNFVPISLYQEAELWEQMISEVPFEIMIENTTRMAKLKLLHGNSRTKQTFRSRCEDKSAIETSGIHPFPILAGKETYRNGTNDVKRKPTWIIDPEILSSLNTAMLTAMERNLKSTGQRYLITIDASDSMKAHLFNNDHVQCRLAASLLTLCLAKAENKVVVKAFALELQDINIEPTTTIDDIAKILDNTPLGGCDCSRPIIYAKKSKIKVDMFVVFTDRETWRGKTTPFEALRQYRKMLKIPAKLIVVYLNPDNLTRTKRMTNTTDRGVMEIYGFSASMAQSMRSFATYPF